MTFDEFLAFRDVKIRDFVHERILRLFYGYLASVTGDGRLLPDLLGRLTGIDLSATTAKTGCFNGASDGMEPPYENVDFYVRFENSVGVYIYGTAPGKKRREPEGNEYLLIVLSNDLERAAVKTEGRTVVIQ